MSGLCGVVRFDGAAATEGEVAAMAAAAAHRSVDGTHLAASGGAALAWQAHRLSPESAAEVQPHRDGDLLVVADARLDDRPALLAALGPDAPPAHAPDVALITAAYRRWGRDFPSRLLGDFAIVIVDTATREVLAVRDPMGMRPLHYRIERHRRILLASEATQILAAPDVPRRISEPAIAAHLALCHNDLRATVYEGIVRVAPGEALLVDGDGDRMRRWSWFALDPDERIDGDEREHAEQLRELLARAVADRLRTTKPVGVLLSGGIDSGSVAATAGWLREQGRTPQTDLRTYSWAYTTAPECDERYISDLIVARYGLAGTDVPTAGGEPLSGLPEHGSTEESPFFGIYQPIIDRAVAQAASDGVGVLLGGDRGDVVVGPTAIDYALLARHGQLRALRREMLDHRRATSESLPAIAWRHLARPAWGLARSRTLRGWADHLLGREERRGKHEWIDREWAASVGLPALLARRLVPPPDLSLGRADRLDLLLSPLQVVGAEWSNRGYARLGVVFADPFSDVRLARFALAVPPQVIARPGSADKRLARAAMEGVMPEEARRQAGKILPTTFYRRALRTSAAPVIADLTTGTRMADRGWVREEPLRSYAADVTSGAIEPAVDLWAALSLEQWMRRWWD